jgi:hypothetical protein
VSLVDGFRREQEGRHIEWSNSRFERA